VIPVIQQLAPSHSASWYAVIVRNCQEKNVSAHLHRKGIHSFLPLYRTRRCWSDRVKIVEQPLFPSYVFCRLAPDMPQRIVTTPGIVSFVGFGSGPAPIPEAEIDAVRRLIEAGGDLLPWPFLREGDRVRITSGPLRDLEGHLVQAKKDLRFVVTLQLLQRSVAVTVDRDIIAPIRSRIAAAAQ
jgi:transcription termination/antitermination protein NusG